MKSLFLKIVLVIGIIGISVIGYKSDLFSVLSDFTSVVARNLVNSISKSVPDNIEIPFVDTSLLSKESDTVYKWKDSAGRLHYSNELPKGNSNAVKIEISRQQNVLQSKKSVSDQAAGKPLSDMGEKGRLSGIFESYNKPMEKAVDARKKMEQHNRELENVLR